MKQKIGQLFLRSIRQGVPTIWGTLSAELSADIIPTLSGTRKIDGNGITSFVTGAVISEPVDECDVSTLRFGGRCGLAEDAVCLTGSSQSIHSSSDPSKVRSITSIDACDGRPLITDSGTIN